MLTSMETDCSGEQPSSVHLPPSVASPPASPTDRTIFVFAPPAYCGPATLSHLVSLVFRSGLSVASAAFDAPALYQLARESLQCEETIASGCMMLQAATLLRCFHLHFGKDPLLSHYHAEAKRFRQDTTPHTTHTVDDFYAGAPFPLACSGQSNGQATTAAMQSTTSACSSSTTVHSSNGSSGNRTLHSHSGDVAWRINFAFNIYEVLHEQEFKQLEPLLMHTSISTIRTLAQKFWYKDNLPLFRNILHLVSAHEYRKNELVSALTKWDRKSLQRPLNEAEQEEVLLEFKRRMQVHASSREASKQSKREATWTLQQLQLGTQASSSKAAVQQQQTTPSLQHIHPLGAFSEVHSGIESVTPPAVPSIVTACPSLDGSTHLEGPPPAVVGLQHVTDLSAAAAMEDVMNDHPVADSPASSLSVLTEAAMQADGKAARSSSSADKVLSVEKHRVARPKSFRLTVPVAQQDHLDGSISNASVEATEGEAPGRSHPRKRRRSARQHNSQHVAATTLRARLSPMEDATVKDTLTIPSLRAPLLIPLELLSLGISGWLRKRQSAAVSVSHCEAMDDALAELMWQLADQLTDGERLDLPEFQQARRSESRLASAAHNARMEGDRQCTIMLGMLEKLSLPSTSEQQEEGTHAAAKPSATPRHAAETTPEVAPPASLQMLDAVQPQSMTDQQNNGTEMITTTGTTAALTSSSFAEMHWDIVRASDHSALLQLQSQWWRYCNTSKANVRAAWSRLKTQELQVKASEQRDATELATEELRQQTVAELRARLQAMGVDAAPHLYAPVIKLLRSPPGAGRQLVHFDVPSSARLHLQRGDAGMQKAPQCYSCILHLDPGDTQSTYVPTLSAAQMQPLSSAKGPAWEKQSERLCHPGNFRSHVMHAGDLLVFRTDVPHYGPANESSSEWRWVLFVLFSPVPEPDQDETQEFLDCLGS